MDLQSVNTKKQESDEMIKKLQMLIQIVDKQNAKLKKCIDECNRPPLIEIIAVNIYLFLKGSITGLFNVFKPKLKAS
jgi:hypothetical protein